LQCANCRVIRVRWSVDWGGAKDERAAEFAVLIPPTIPAEKRIEGVAQEPDIVESSVQAQDRYRADWRFGAIEALPAARAGLVPNRSEEHTSELQSLTNLVCRLLL